MTIKENVALPLKLQQKNAADAEIDEALKTVGLDGFAERNSNELSGGQKQRVAIARALVKDPKIVFADEPTGSLDSKTGAQIFDILKEFSKTRLVIVVSHDLDSALSYGDRIIELADGKISGDRTKTGELNLSELKKEYSEKVDEKFKNTETLCKVREDSFRQIKTRMPFKSAVKMAVSNFKAKKIRFAFTLILMAVTLTVFGLADTMKNYDAMSATLGTIHSLGIGTLTVSDTVKETVNDRQEVRVVELSDNKIGEMSEARKTDIYRCYKRQVKLTPYNTSGSAASIYKLTFRSVVELSERVDEAVLGSFYGARLLIGNFPSVSADAIEVLISDYMADGIMYYGAKLYPNSVVPNTGRENILNKTFSASDVVYKIVGIFSTDYAEMDFTAKNNFRAAFNKENIYTAMLADKSAAISYMSSSFAAKTNLLINSFGNDYPCEMTAGIVGVTSVSELSPYLTQLRAQIKWADGYGSDSVLKDGEVIVSFDRFVQILELYGIDESGELSITFENADLGDYADAKLSLKTVSDDRAELYSVLK